MIPIFNNGTTAIYVTRNNSNWNDFGYNYRAIFRFYKNQSIVFHCNGYYMPLEESRKHEYAHHKKTQNPLPEFISLLPEQSNYLKLLEIFGKEYYKIILNRMNDMNALKKTNEAAHAYIKGLEDFYLGILRSAEAYKTFNSNLYPVIAKPLEDAKINFSYSTHLQGFSGNHILEIEYGNFNFFEDRAHCLIGINGTGKTRLLHSLLIDCATNEKLFSQEEIKCFLESTQLHETPGKDRDNNLPDFSRIIFYSSDADSIIPKQLIHDGGFDYHHFNITAANVASESTTTLARMLVNIVRTEQEDKIDYEELLEDALSDFLSLSEILIPLDRKNLPSHFRTSPNTPEGWIRLNEISGEQYTLETIAGIDETREIAIYRDKKITALSSGHRAFLRFSLHFISHASSGTLVLIDEPETHLHPNLVTQFMSLLYEILEATKSVAIIATHSSYIVREIPRHCVHILERDGLNINTEKVYMQTLGANVNEISTHVFGDSQVDTYHNKLTRIIESSGMTFEEVVYEYKDIFNVKLLSEIKKRIDQREP